MKNAHDDQDSKVASTPIVLGSSNRNPTNISFVSLIAEDFHTHERNLVSPGFWALFNHRFGNWRMGIKNNLIRAPFSLLYKIHKQTIHWFCGIQLDYTVIVGRRVKLEHFGGMILIANEIGDDVIIRQNTTFGIKSLKNLHDRPRIGDRVSIGAGAVIVGGITIGHDCIIGPNTVVYQDIPPFSTVYPPRPIVKSRPNV